ncbi:MAG: T9SS type A sorting domain-containing protein [Planctomycetes bacterium]|nr:T9SS type A sorting domain-containing protein [Planctomycetota bacterium]
MQQKSFCNKIGTFWGIISLLILIPAFGFANGILFDAAETSLQTTQSTMTELNLINSLAGMDSREIQTDQGVFTELLIAGYGHNNDIGQPQLPVLHKLIELPQGAEIEVNVIDYDLQEYNLGSLNIAHPLLPVQPPRPKNQQSFEFQYDPAAYQQDVYSPQELVTVDVVGNLRGLRLGRLNIAPIQYNPVRNTINVFSNIEVEIYFSGADIVQTEWEKLRTSSPYFNFLAGLVLNYQPVDPGQARDTITQYPVKYVIVSDPMFSEALQPFIEWKRKKGFYVIEAYTDQPEVGNSTTSIKSYLQGLYDQGTPDDPCPSFVLFVGDINQVPSFSGQSGSHVTDLHFCEYNGDYLPEMYYGRFSANNLVELQPQIDKTLEYEQYLMPDPSFLNEVVMISGVDAGHAPTWGNGQINYGTTYYFNEEHGITSHTYLYPESGSSDAAIIQDVSDGVAFANYTAHGSSSGWADPTFSISDVAGLQNQSQYPLMIGNACLTNKFDVSICFGEALLRAENKGAIGYIGASNNSYWDEDYYWGVGVGPILANPTYEQTGLGAYDRTFHDHGEPESDWYVTQDGMIFAGNLAVTEGSPSSMDYYWEMYHLMGDPSVMIYFSQPPAMSPVYNSMLPLGIDEFTVTTEPGAYVAVSMDGELHGAGLADESGQAELIIDPFLVPGIADVVITKQNWQPYVGTVVIASPDGAYLLYSNHEIDDLLGNGNDQADYGESILLDLTLENFGNETALDVIAVLSTADSYVTISDDTANFESVPAGETVTQLGAFAFDIADDVPDQHQVQFELEVSGTYRDIWNSTFFVTINAPHFTIGLLSIDDAEGGDGDGRLDAGETVDLIIPTTNDGHAISPVAAAVIACSDEYISVVSGTFGFAEIEVDATEYAIFTIEVSPDAPIGHPVFFAYQVTAGSYEASTEFSTAVGLIIEDFETGDFSRYPWEHGGSAEWAIVSQEPYEGVYAAQSGVIGHNLTTELSIILAVTVETDISFYRKVSSEDGYDFLNFYIDGAAQDQWSGEMAWSEVSYVVTPGNHTFTWTYEKDGSVSDGSDAGWIDYIILPPFGPSIPENLQAIHEEGFINLYWALPPHPEGLLGYNVYRDGEKMNLDLVTEATYTDSGFDFGNTYCYTVKAVYDQGVSGPSNEFCITPTLNFPLNLVGEVFGNNSAMLLWDVPDNSLMPGGNDRAARQKTRVSHSDQTGKKSKVTVSSAPGTRGTRDLTGYNVYRDQQMIGSTSAGITTYFDFNLDLGEYCYTVTAIYEVGESEPSNEVWIVIDYLSVEPGDEAVDLPNRFALDQNFPNPFNPSTTINYALPKAGRVILKVYNAAGREVTTLVNGERPAGYHNVAWNGKNATGSPATSGIYFYRIEVNDPESTCGERYVEKKRMILLK